MSTSGTPLPDDPKYLTTNPPADPPALVGNDIANRFDPNPFSDDHNDNGMYGDFTFDIEYSLSTGEDVAMVTGVPSDATVPTNIKVRFGNPTMLMIVKWSTERTNNKPVCPPTDTGDPNNVLVKSVVYPSLPLQGTAKLTWRISGVYVYKMLIAKTPERGSKFMCGASPAEKRLSSDNCYSYSDFDNRLIDFSFAKEADAVAPTTPERSPQIELGIPLPIPPSTA